jgi:hypothetical protein
MNRASLSFWPRNLDGELRSRQLGDVECDPPRFGAGQQVGVGASSVRRELLRNIETAERQSG